MSTAEFFQVFTYPSNWNLQLNLVFILIAILYLVVTGPLVGKIPGATSVPVSKKIYFMFAILVFNFAESSPIALVAHELFSMHMFQMSLLFIVLPPFLLLGLPDWMIRPVISLPILRSLGKFFTKPIVILFVFNGSLSLYHVPYVFDALMENMLYHSIAHAILLALALCMWWPIVCPIPELDRVKPLMKLAYIFANGFLLTPACALIIFADAPLFAGYTDQSQLFPIMEPLADQSLGGIIMKIMQEIVYISAISIVLSRWMKEQKKQDEKDLEAVMADQRMNLETVVQ